MEIPDLQRIKITRKKLGLTQSDLAKICEISQSMINKIENGKKEPSYKTAKRIFEELDKESKALSTKNGKASDINSKFVVSLKPNDTIEEAIKKLGDNYDQLPVIDNDGKCIGTISSSLIIKLWGQTDVLKEPVKDQMSQPLPLIGDDTPLSHIRKMLEVFEAVLTANQGNITGIITRSDLIKEIKIEKS
ncbi:MAG: CBS domain-containing protein [archaeon]|nr:CBS domain-containing protein [archaeon]